MLNRRSVVVVGCVFVGFALSAGPGLVARAAEPERWVGAIAVDASKSAANESAAQRRVAELERRVKELEAERRGASNSGGEKAQQLAAAIARNEELVEHNRALALENQELAQSRAHARPEACELPDDVDAKTQLRFWAQRMRDGESGFRGRLSSEWNAALNVVLRGERPLDPRNPWRE
jgi:hypothetical protein